MKSYFINFIANRHEKPQNVEQILISVINRLLKGFRPSFPPLLLFNSIKIMAKNENSCFTFLV